MKKIMIIVMALAFVISASTNVLASRSKCTVDSVDNQTVTMTCERADRLTVGDNVTVRASSRVKCTVDSIEGQTVTMTCEDAANLTVGGEVTVRVVKEKALEGC